MMPDARGLKLKAQKVLLSSILQVVEREFKNGLDLRF